MIGYRTVAGRVKQKGGGPYGRAEGVVVGFTQLDGAVQVEVVRLRHEAEHVEGEARQGTALARARAGVPVQNGDGVVGHAPWRVEMGEGSMLTGVGAGLILVLVLVLFLMVLVLLVILMKL